MGWIQTNPNLNAINIHVYNTFVYFSVWIVSMNGHKVNMNQYIFYALL